MSRKARPSRSAGRKLPETRFERYLENTRLPLTSLVFLLPLVIVYESCALMLQPSVQISRNLVAANAIEAILAWFGPAGFWVPGLVLIFSLIAWHVLRRDPTTVLAWVPPLMLVESIALTLPLFVLSGLTQGVTLEAHTAVSKKTELVLVLGAGIYEELVFRLLLITLIMFVLVDFFRLKTLHAMIVGGAIAALTFAACHYAPIGVEQFRVDTFAMRAIAGGYLTMVFLSRGIGISTGCHVAYNMIAVLLVH